MSRDVDVGDMVTIKGKTINKNFIIDNISSDENYFYIDIYDILDNDFKLKLYGLDDKWKIYEKKEFNDDDYIINFFDKNKIPNYKFYFTIGPPNDDYNFNYNIYVYYLDIKNTYAIVNGKKILVSTRHIDNEGQFSNSNQNFSIPKKDEIVDFPIDKINYPSKKKILNEIGIGLTLLDLIKIYRKDLSIKVDNKIYTKKDLELLLLQNIEYFIIEDDKEKILFPHTSIIPIDKEGWCCILKLNNILIGFSYGSFTDQNNVYINYIEIHPEYRGKHLCFPFLKFILKKLLIRGIKKFELMNSSGVNKGIPACFCYYKAPHSLGLTVTNEEGMELTDKTCFKDEIPKQMFFSV